MDTITIYPQLAVGPATALQVGLVSALLCRVRAAGGWHRWCDQLDAGGVERQRAELVIEDAAAGLVARYDLRSVEALWLARNHAAHVVAINLVVEHQEAHDATALILRTALGTLGQRVRTLGGVA